MNRSVSVGDAVGPAHGDAHGEEEASGEGGAVGDGGAAASGPGEVQRRGSVPPQWRRTGTEHFLQTDPPFSLDCLCVGLI